jgi:hypothetical protein
MTSEIWKPVVGWEDLYEVSSHGRPRSLDRMVRGRAGSRISRPGRVMKPRHHRNGYPSYGLSRDGSPTFRFIHALVLKAFVGPRPAGCLGCHNDGDPTDNHLENHNRPPLCQVSPEYEVSPIS